MVRARTCATVPCPCGQAGMTVNVMGSRRAAESAVSWLSAMVDSYEVDPGQAVVWCYKHRAAAALRKGCDGMKTLAILAAKASRNTY